MTEEFLGQGLKIILYTGWLAIFPIAYVLFKDNWYARKIGKYVDNIDWVLLELRLQDQNPKGLRSMEQVFASLYGTFSFGILKRDRFFKGQVENWLSLEMVGFSNSIHFYIRVPRELRKLVESAFFSQYPYLEIIEVEDYVNLLPKDLPNDTYDIFATDFILSKKDVYPIKTHMQFEFAALTEEKYIDPIASIMEVMSHLNKNELIWIQWLIRPTDDSWTKGAKGVIDELSGKSVSKKKSKVQVAGNFAQDLTRAPFVHPGEVGSSETSTPPPSPLPGAQDIIKSVQNKISKNAFEVIPRMVYIDEKNAFTTENFQAVLGAFRQFSSMQSQNAFRPSVQTLTTKKYASKIPLKGIKTKALIRRKKIMYQHYINRIMPQGLSDKRGDLQLKPIILNIEEMATVFHPPITNVRAPGLQPTESKKGEPPINLPTRE